MNIGDVYKLEYRTHYNEIKLSIHNEIIPNPKNPTKNLSYVFNILTIGEFSYHIDNKLRKSIRNRLSYVRNRKDSSEAWTGSFDSKKVVEYPIYVTVQDIIIRENDVIYVVCSRSYNSINVEYLFHLQFLTKYWKKTHAS